VNKVRKTVDMGYGLVDVFEFWEYEVTCLDKDTNSGGIFTEYVNMILKLKQESSVYAFRVQSVEHKDKYIEDFRRAEGIVIDKTSISKNAGQRTLAKIRLKSMWGKWAQKLNKNKTTIVISEKEFYVLLTSPGAEVTNLIFPKEEVAGVSWKYSEDNVASGNNVNVAIAAYLTKSRLKFYE